MFDTCDFEEHEMENDSSCVFTVKSSKCFLCQYVIKTDVTEHYKGKHGITIEEENHEFRTMEEFTKWKENIEKVTLSKYVEAQSSKTLKDGSVVNYFLCHKSIDSEQNSHCTSKIIKKESSENIIVQFVKTHVGHSGCCKPPILSCNICNKTFSAKQGLSNHIKSHSNVHSCKNCNKIFRDAYNLKKHVMVKNNGCGFPIKTYKCFICECEIKKSDISQHYREIHCITIEEENHEFNTIDEFTKWKENIEKITLSKYTQQRKSRSNKDGTKVTYFHCHRDGYFQSKGQNTRHLKLMGSNKINTRCVSKMIVKEASESITVKFVKTHVGHSMDLIRFPLSKKEEVYDEMIIFEKSKVLKQLQHLRKKHREALKERPLLVPVLFEDGIIKEWNVFSNSNTKVCVLNRRTENCACNLRCVDCNACAHNYNCSCPDSVSRENMCKHIHALCISIKEQELGNETICVVETTPTSADAIVEVTEEDAGNFIQDMYEPIEESVIENQETDYLVDLDGGLSLTTNEYLNDQIITIDGDKVSRQIHNLRDRHNRAVEERHLLIPVLNKRLREQNLLLKENTKVYIVSCKTEECPCTLRCDDCTACIHNYSCTCLDSVSCGNMCKHIHAFCMRIKEQELENETISVVIEITPVDNYDEINSGVSEDDMEDMYLHTQWKNDSIADQKSHVLEAFKGILDLVNTQEEVDIVVDKISPIESIIRSAKGKRKASFSKNEDTSENSELKKICL